jgi:hypothetical protein
MDEEAQDGHFVSLRQLTREHGVDPGATIRFPEVAEKTDFWDSYPRDEQEFRRLVIPESYSDEGICYAVPREYHPPRSLKESYWGIARQEVSRLCFPWRSDQKQFEARHSPEIVEAITEFLEDRSQREAEEKATLDAEIERQRPPTPPIGYYWRSAPSEWEMEVRYVLAIE